MKFELQLVIFIYVLLQESLSLQHRDLLPYSDNLTELPTKNSTQLSRDQIRIPTQRVSPGVSECFQVNGADYRGNQDQTSVENGKRCLYWNETRQHAYNTRVYPNGEWGLGNHNYCRNPDGDVQPWCYISESEEGIYWKYCSIPSCTMPGYLGCFVDTGSPATLSGSSGTSTKLTVQVCVRFCRRKGYELAGLEAGYACFCGSRSDLRGQRRTSLLECNQVCFGQSSQLCGGDGRLGVYEVSVGSCGGDLRSRSGVIYSPEYPDTYKPDSECFWDLRLPAAQAVELDIRLFELREGGDRLEVQEGRTGLQLATFAGGSSPLGTHRFHASWIRLRFLSNSVHQGQGFALVYRGLENDDVRTWTEAPRSSPTETKGLETGRSNRMMTGIAAWAMYTAVTLTGIIILVTVCHLHKSTCTRIQQKMALGLLALRRQSDLGTCHTTKGWAVTYKHSTEVLVGPSTAQSVGADLASPDTLSSSSLKSLLNSN
ncbi:kremen protein 2-like [Mobula hypostoma]|uniref:kremen protein 2-like n=1 Tax=Mobula hypostoma TaxID=723540 RepID=UPI002FC3C7FF